MVQMYAAYRRLERHSKQRDPDPLDLDAVREAGDDLLNAQDCCGELAPLILDEVDRITLGLPLIVPSTMVQAPL
jgi:hypothetical protein